MDMNFKKPIVFVLGAGFTKAFDNDAPTLFCDIGLDELKEDYRKAKLHRLVSFIDRLKINDDGSANIEELMSRLYSGMPFDDEILYEEEGKLLLRAIEEKFKDRLSAIKMMDHLDLNLQDLLRRFAGFIIDNHASVITFNYDCLLDEALHLHRPTYIAPFAPSAYGNYWSPDGSYGFFCKSSVSCVREDSFSKDQTDSLLLKLHGSLNWRTKLGSTSPFSPDDIVHHEDWFKVPDYSGISKSDLDPYLNKGAFFIPPVLDKSIMTKESVLRLIWSLAFKKLSEANTVVFMGYSLPVTDIAVRFLFRESLNRKNKPEVIVVNIGDDQESKKKPYFEVLDTDLISGKTFDFSGVLSWIENNIPSLKKAIIVSSENASQSTSTSAAPSMPDRSSS